jgi:hypothetical protein
MHEHILKVGVTQTIKAHIFTFGFENLTAICVLKFNVFLEFEFLKTQNKFELE